MPSRDRRRISESMLELLKVCESTAPVCPSEVARALTADEAGWRALMLDVGRVAPALAERALLRDTQGEAAVHAQRIGGPFRLRNPAVR